MHTTATKNYEKCSSLIFSSTTPHTNCPFKVIAWPQIAAGSSVITATILETRRKKLVGGEKGRKKGKRNRISSR